MDAKDFVSYQGSRQARVGGFGRVKACECACRLNTQQTDDHGGRWTTKGNNRAFYRAKGGIRKNIYIYIYIYRIFVGCSEPEIVVV